MGQRDKYRVAYAPTAYTDLDELFAYIAHELHEPDTAFNLIERIEAFILKLQDFPYKAPIARDALLANKGYRMLTVENFAVFYLVDDEKQAISIRRIVYGKRNFQWLL
ncbi:MAG: type II toxin-antitoxin system RelE/ParE family toxin [Clostridia bacterium]|nr:type II toxin-antitoxin system RelE/ParE family toxin [Clostridia bacterium]